MNLHQLYNLCYNKQLTPEIIAQSTYKPVRPNIATVRLYNNNKSSTIIGLFDEPISEHISYKNYIALTKLAKTTTPTSEPEYYLLKLLKHYATSNSLLKEQSHNNRYFNGRIQNV